MLASITPLGERGRGSSYPVTLVALGVGATAAGAAGGAILGLAGGLMLPTRAVDLPVRLGLLAGAAALALALDVASRPVPGPRRQVDARWRDRYRGWCYGVGYGTQLGLGVVTIVTSAATYLAGWAALLSGSATAGALIAGTYGAIRGWMPLAAHGVGAPAQLISLHRHLARWRSPMGRGVQVVLALILVVAGVGTIR